jgi:hypothetical protein
LVKHARYYWLLLAEIHLTRRLFGAMVGRIATELPAGLPVKLQVFTGLSPGYILSSPEERDDIPKH